MLALYAPDAEQVERLRVLFPLAEDVIATTEWPRFVSAARTAVCAVVATAYFDRGAIRRLSHLAGQQPLTPLIVIT